MMLLIKKEPINYKIKFTPSHFVALFLSLVIKQSQYCNLYQFSDLALAIRTSPASPRKAKISGSLITPPLPIFALSYTKIRSDLTV